MRIRTTLLVLALALPCIAVAANQVYRWTDANGVVHFSASPPAGNVDYKMVSVDSGASYTPQKTQQQSTDQPEAPAETETQQAETPAPAPSASPKEVADTPENRIKLCQQLNANIALMQSDQAVILNGQVLTKEDRAARLNKAQQTRSKLCK